MGRGQKQWNTLCNVKRRQRIIAIILGFAIIGLKPTNNDRKSQIQLSKVLYSDNVRRALQYNRRAHSVDLRLGIHRTKKKDW